MINKNIYDITLTAGGGTVNLSLKLSDQPFEYRVKGTATLTSDWTIQSNAADSAFLNAGTTFIYHYEAEITLSGNSITFHGSTLPTQLADKNCTIIATYNGSSWIVKYHPDWEESDNVETDDIVDDAVTTAKVLDDNITNAKLADMNRGTVKVANSSGEPSDLDIKDGKIPQGNGTDVEALDVSTSGNIIVGDGKKAVSVAPSGDVSSISSAGSFTLASKSGRILLDSTISCAGSSTTAVTTEETLLSRSVPLNSLTANGESILIKAWGTFASNANAKTIRLKENVASITIDQNAVITNPNGLKWLIEAQIYYAGSTSGCGFSKLYMGGEDPEVTIHNSASWTWTANQTIEVTGQNGTASANDITCNGLSIEIIK
jgi:hypothetical protein